MSGAEKKHAAKARSEAAWQAKKAAKAAAKLEKAALKAGTVVEGGETNDAEGDAATEGGQGGGRKQASGQNKVRLSGLAVGPTN